MGDELAASNVNRSYSLAATSIAIFTFMLFFLFPRFTNGEIDPLLFQATLIVMGVATFSFVFSSFYYYCSSLGGGIEDAERERYSRRGDRFWLLGCILLFLGPSLVLFSIGLTVVGSAWLALWLAYLLFAIRFFPKIQGARRSAAAALLLSGFCAAPLPAGAQAAPATEQEISDAYIYLLGRLLVMRQQHLDFQEGFQWNEIVHRTPGGVDWPNPNLDVAYSEAWIAVDEGSCTIVSVPKIEGRYYTVQFLNGWGETLANINERLFPKRAHGNFAMCLRGSAVKVPDGALRIDLPVKYARILSRVELGADPDAAVALQRQFKLRATGSPKLPVLPKALAFELEKLPGVEAFDFAEVALDSEVDLNPGLEPLQAKTRAVAKSIADPAERERVDRVVRTRAFADFAKGGKIIGHGTVLNGWARPGMVGEYGLDYLARTLVDQGGIWANVKPEVLYYRGSSDSTGAELDAANVYTLTFPKDALPARFATHFWSVIAVDGARFRVLPNPLKRYLLNNQSKLQYGADGSLTLYFADQKPAAAPEGNWLPTPKGAKYRLTFRFYRPIDGVANGTYYPPALVKR